jgi:hypothetical protein
MIPLASWRSDRVEALVFWTGTLHDNTQVISRHRSDDASWGEPDGPFPSGVRGDMVAALGTAVIDRVEGAPLDELGTRVVAALTALREAVDRNDGGAIDSSVRAVADLFCLDRAVAGSPIILLAPVVLEGARARLVGRERRGDREWFRLELVSGQGRQRDRTVLPVPARPVQGAPDRWSFCI